MLTNEHSPAPLISAQLSCNGCPLRVHGPVPIHLPLHVVGPASLLVLPRPYSDVVSPAEDPRLAPLVAAVPELAVFAVTYATNCWSDPSLPPPVRAMNACKRHRAAEVETLTPTTIVAVGDPSCQQYLGVSLSKAAGQVWQHGSGAYVVPVSEGALTAEELALLRTALDRHGLGFYDLS